MTLGIQLLVPTLGTRNV